MDDKNLLQGCINRDKKSWDLFVERYGKLIYSTLHHVLGEKGVANKQDIIDVPGEEGTSAGTGG